MKKFNIFLLFVVALTAKLALAIEDPTVFRPLESYVVATVTSSSTTVATPVTQGRFVIRLLSTTDAFIALASTKPFASQATGFVLAAGIPEYIRVNQGEFIAVRASNTPGTLHIGQMGR